MTRATRRIILANLLVPVVAYVVWDQIETRALANRIAAIAARGEPTTVDAIPAGGDTSERQLAARVYAAAAEQVRALPREITFRLPRIDVDSVAIPTVNLEELERTYRHDAPALQLLDQAAPLDFNGFGDFAPDVADQFLPTLASLCVLRADLLSARGRGDVAARALVPCVRAWRIFSIQARSQISPRLLGSLRILLRHTQPPEPALAELQNALAMLPDTDELVTDVQHRRARFLDEIAAPRTTLFESLVRRVARPYVTRVNRRQLDTFEEALAVAAQPWPEKVAAADEIERRYAEAFRSSNRRGFLARLTAPPGIGFGGLALLPAARDLAARRVSVATLAVERYHRANRGALPASLDALVPAYLAAVPVDPFSGHPLAYTQTEGGYRLYSVDIDRKDDGGVLYGIGSKHQLMPQQRSPRDLGIEVTASR